jgi:integrase
MPTAKPKSGGIDLSRSVGLSVELLERLSCPDGKQQAFLRDSKAPGLRVRVTATGTKSFVFEAKLNRRTIRRTIGDVKSWTIESARAEARRLAVVLDNGQDPRELEREQQQVQAALKVAQAAQAVTFAQAWHDYIEERTPFWGAAHLENHLRAVNAGGVSTLRGTRGRGVTVSGPLHSLMDLSLRELSPEVVERWAAKEAQQRQASARLAWVLLKVFLGWCSEHPKYRLTVPNASTVAKGRRVRDLLGKPKAKTDALLREQLPVWFDAVGQLNPTASAYLKVLLLTGARPGEVLGLKWADVDTRWRGLTIRDKVDGERVIPLTPYVENLLASMPRRGMHVFESAEKPGQSIAPPRQALVRACAVAGIAPALTLHGLRRSFKTLTEWLEVPVGVVAQIQGHKPSATAEKHYTVRPLDMLRLHHDRIEAWLLEQAGVQFEAPSEPGRLRIVV